MVYWQKIPSQIKVETYKVCCPNVSLQTNRIRFVTVTGAWYAMCWCITYRRSTPGARIEIKAFLHCMKYWILWHQKAKTVIFL